MINKVILIGNVGTEPEIRSLESGVKVARLRVATTEKFTTTLGERKEHTEWHTVILWRGQAEFAERYIKKGTQVYVEGKIRSRERIDELANKKTYYEIHADEIKTLGKREHSPGPAAGSCSSAVSGSTADSSAGVSGADSSPIAVSEAGVADAAAAEEGLQKSTGATQNVFAHDNLPF